jgi:acetoin utilization protein AcuB
MSAMPTLRSEMTEFPYSVEISAPLMEAQDFMRAHKIRHLPVTDDGVLIGIVTDRDIKLLFGPDFQYPDPDELKVSDAVVEQSYVADVDTPLESVLEHMAEHHIGSALVTENGELQGIFTSTEACRAFAVYLSARQAA